MRKKLYRSRKEKIVAGVCGGVGEYLDVDPTIVRVGYLLVTVFTALVPGVLAYIILIFVVPEQPESGTWREESEGPPHRPWA